MTISFGNVNTRQPETQSILSAETLRPVAYLTHLIIMANRLAQVSGHLSNAHGRGLLSGEVAIITG